MGVLDDITVETLSSYEGKNIKDICNTGYDAPNVNHCAHFVSHVLGLTYGLVCGSMKYETKGQGTTLRVDDIYNNCSSRGLWRDKPASVNVCIAFVTLPFNVRDNEMGDHPKKHVGIFKNGTIWQYANRSDRVTTYPPEQWHNVFKGLYGASTEMYYGVL